MISSAVFAEVRAALSTLLGAGSSRTKGEALEVFFGELLEELGARNVTRCRPGLQFGRDFMFNRSDFGAEGQLPGGADVLRDLLELRVTCDVGSLA
jgi:hypothetical protein